MAKIKVKNQHIHLSHEPRGAHLTNRCLTVDARVNGFYLKGWRGETRFDIDYKGSHPVDIWQTPDSIEIDIVVDSKPLSNVFTYDIQTKGLSFHYQPELTQEEIAEGGIYRPDNIVGSYAVYHSSKANNYKYSNGTEKNYKTGKAFHIYRPKAYDVKGEWRWCDLYIDNDKLVVTVPQDFLDTAKYPVVVDPKFGVETEGGSAGYSRAFCNVHADYVHTASAGDTIISYHVYTYSGAAPEDFGMAVYSLSGDDPQSRLAAQVNVSITSASPAVWYTAGCSQELSDGVTYGVAGASPNYTVPIIYHDVGSGVQASRNSSATLPATWDESQTSTGIFSIYVTYEVGGAAEETATFNSDSHIYDVETKTFNSDSNVYEVETETFNSDSNVYGTETGTFDSDSHIWTDETSTFNSDSHIYSEDTDTFDSDSNVYDEETSTFNSDSNVYDKETATFGSDSHIWNVETKTFNSNSNVYDTETDTFNSNSNIYKEETETFNSNSNVYDVETETFSSNSQIYSVGEETATFNSDSNVYKEETKTFNSNSNVYDTKTGTFNSNSNVYDTETVTFSSDSYIWTGVDDIVIEIIDITYNEIKITDITYDEVEAIDITYNEIKITDITTN